MGVASMRFAFGKKQLLRVCIIAVLVCLAEIVVIDVMGQYLYSSFGLIDGAAHRQERIDVSFQQNMIIPLSIAIGCYSVGLLSSCHSPFAVLKWMCIVSA